jgi:hypothetical protein
MASNQPLLLTTARINRPMAQQIHAEHDVRITMLNWLLPHWTALGYMPVTQTKQIQYLPASFFFVGQSYYKY